MRWVALALATCALLSAEVARFTVRETAGLRRFGYPVRARVRAGAAALRLVDGGKPVPAQFTRLDDGQVEIDFGASLAPWQSRIYQVEEGAGPALAPGVSIEETAVSFLVHHPGGLEFDVPKNALGLMNGMRSNRHAYLRPNSEGLILNYRDDIEYRAGGVGPWGEPAKARIVKRGPLACALRFDTVEALRGNRSVRTVIEMEFPHSKSWVEVRWTVDDPERFISAMIADLNFLVEGESALVDFGAGSMVYATLRERERATLVSTPPSWTINIGGDPFAVGGTRAEGWAHIMDRQRVTAIAVDGFGEGRGAIDIGGDGRVRLRKDFVGGAERSLRFWLHFVEVPVQSSARTSPQAMLSPLVVE